MEPPSTIEDVVERFRGADQSTVGLYADLAPVYAFTMDQRDVAAAYEELVTSALPADTGSVVEFACGHGALLDRLTEGYDTVLGLDRSRPLLAMARSRYGVPVVRADVRRQCLRPSFDAVAMVGRSLGHLLTERDVDACFAVAFETLSPDGRFVVDCHDRSVLSDEYTRERTFESNRYRVEQRTESVVLDRNRGVVERTDRFVVTAAGTGDSVTVETDPWRLRTFEADFLIERLERAGFSVRRLDSAYGGHQVVAEK